MGKHQKGPASIPVHFHIARSEVRWVGVCPRIPPLTMHKCRKLDATLENGLILNGSRPLQNYAFEI